jgi:hypothetical protein
LADRGVVDPAVSCWAVAAAVRLFRNKSEEDGEIQLLAQTGKLSALKALLAGNELFAARLVAAKMRLL